jgi:hypothetical protein
MTRSRKGHAAVDAPTTLPQKLYLLAYDAGRRRLGSRLEIGYALRAAALVELHLRGHLIDRDGPVPAENGRQCADPVLNAVLQQIARTPHKSWRHWVRADHRAMTTSVRDQLHALGVLDLRRHHRLGIIPTTTIIVADLPPVLRIANDALRALRDDEPSGGTASDAAALLVLAAIAGLPGVAARTRLGADRQRIDQLARQGGPAIPALRSVIRGRRAAASG